MIKQIVNAVILTFLVVGGMNVIYASEQPDTTRILTLEEARTKYAGVSSQFVDIEGINVHYRDEGKGPVILLTHGTLGDLVDWDEWAEVLTSHFRVVRFDLPGFGLTGNIANGNYSVSRSHVLIDGLMDHLGVEKFAVVGISYGGMVMFRYAATRSDRVTAMVLVNSAGIQRGKQAKQATSAKANQPAKPRKSIFTHPIVLREEVEAFYKAYINDPERRTPALIQRKLDLLNIEQRDKLAKLAYQFYEKGNPKRVLAHVKAPSLIMWGTANQALDTETATAFKEALVNACSKDLVTFNEGGHYINLERPYETAKVAKQFFLQLKNEPLPGCPAFEE